MIAARGPLGGGAAREVEGDRPRRAGMESAWAQTKRAENTRVVAPLQRPIPGSWTGNRTARPDAQLQRTSPESVASGIARNAHSETRRGQRGTGRVDAEPARVLDDFDCRAAQRRYAVAPGHGPGRATTRDPNERAWPRFGVPPIWRYSASTQVVRLPMAFGAAAW